MFNFPYKKILIIRLSSLGDVLLTTPLLRSLKKAYPKTEIHFLVREEYKDALINNPNISNLLILKQDVLQVKSTLYQNEYDFVIDLQNNLRSRRLTSGLPCPKARFKKHALQKFLLVKFKINKLKNAPPIPVRYASSLEKFNLDDEGLDVFTNNKPSFKISSLTNVIGMCPGSRHFTKMWPKEYFIELGKRLTEKGYRVALFGGTGDKTICHQISSSVNGSIDLSNDNDILQIAADMKKCSAIVCNDSGLMHLACAVKVPVAVIFGSTVKEFGFTPYRCKNLILENNSLSCRPCSHIGRNKCPKNHFRCMKEITPEMVLSSLTEFLNSK